MFGRTCVWAYNSSFLPTKATTQCGKVVRLSGSVKYPKHCPYCGGIVRKKF